jgi:hypothetical protein
MKQKLLIAGLACAVGVAFAQVQPPSVGDPRKDRAMPGADAWKVRSHEGIKGVAPTTKPSAGFEIQMRPAPTKPRAGYVDPENPDNRVLAPKPADAQRASPLAAPTKPLSPHGPLAAPAALQKPAVQK